MPVRYTTRKKKDEERTNTFIEKSKWESYGEKKGRKRRRTIVLEPSHQGRATKKKQKTSSVFPLPGAPQKPFLIPTDEKMKREQEKKSVPKKVQIESTNNNKNAPTLKKKTLRPNYLQSVKQNKTKEHLKWTENHEKWNTHRRLLPVHLLYSVPGFGNPSTYGGVAVAYGLAAYTHSWRPCIQKLLL